MSTTGKGTRCDCYNCRKARRDGKSTPAPDCKSGQRRLYSPQAHSRCGSFFPATEKARHFLAGGGVAQANGGGDGLAVITTGVNALAVTPRAAPAAAPAPAPSNTPFEQMTVSQAIREGHMYPSEYSWESDEVASDSDEEGLPKKIWVASGNKHMPLRWKMRWGRKNGKAYRPSWFDAPEYVPVEVDEKGNPLEVEEEAKEGGGRGGRGG